MYKNCVLLSDYYTEGLRNEHSKVCTFGPHQHDAKYSNWTFSSYSSWCYRYLMQLPHKVKMQNVHFKIICRVLSFSLEKFLKKLADDQCSFISKGSIYCIHHIPPFSMEVDWPEIWCLMEVLLHFIFAHIMFLLRG